MGYRLKYSLIARLAAERSFVNFSRTNGSLGMSSSTNAVSLGERVNHDPHGFAVSIGPRGFLKQQREPDLDGLVEINNPVGHFLP